VVSSPADPQTDAGDQAGFLTTRVGSLDMVAGPEALMKRQTATAAGKSRSLKIIASNPESTMTVVLAVRSGRKGVDALTCKDLPDAAKDALAAAGLAACTGSPDDALAGFLYQVQKKVG